MSLTARLTTTFTSTGPAQETGGGAVRVLEREFGRTGGPSGNDQLWFTQRLSRQRGKGRPLTPLIHVSKNIDQVLTGWVFSPPNVTTKGPVFEPCESGDNTGPLPLVTYLETMSIC